MIIQIKHFTQTGHRLLSTPDLVTTKCANLHGHSYLFDIQFESEIDKISGLSIDFAAIKELVDRIDHRTLISKDDPLAAISSTVRGIIVVDWNPTAENIAKYVYNLINETFPDIYNLKVSVGEGYKGEITPMVTYDKS